MRHAGECNRFRAILKTIFILAGIAAGVTALSYFVDDQALNVLKHNLSLWSIIALVVIINLVSFGCFIVLYAAWQWVRCDLKPHTTDDTIEA